MRLEMTWSMNPEVPGRLPWLTTPCAGTCRRHRNLLGHGLLRDQRLLHLPFRTNASSKEIHFSSRAICSARLTRIVPLYYIALIVHRLRRMVHRRRTSSNVGLTVWARDVFFCQLLLIQNFTQTYGSYAPSWSITNEVFYYVFYGLIVFAVARFGKWPATIRHGHLHDDRYRHAAFYRLGYDQTQYCSSAYYLGLGSTGFSGALVAEHRRLAANNRGVCEFARCWPLVLALSIAMWCSQRVHLEFVYTSSGVAFTLMLVQFLATDAATKRR